MSSTICNDNKEKENKLRSTRDFDKNPHEPLLFYLRDHELFYISFAGSRYNEYAIYIDYHKWRVSAEILFYDYLNIVKTCKTLLQELNAHPVLVIIPTGFIKTICFYHDYFVTGEPLNLK